MKKTIAIFTYDFFPIIGGQGKHVFEIYQQSKKQKELKTLVFSPAKNNLENHINFSPQSLKNKFQNLHYSYKLNKSLDQLITKYHIDILHFHGGPGGVFLFKKPPIPIIYTVHHTYWQQSNYINSEKWKIIFYFLEKRSYQYADKIICVSQDTLNILKKHYQIKSNKLIYIPNGINQNLLKSTHNTNIKKTEILYVGRIDKRKGTDFLIETMQLINKSDPSIRLNIVGTGKDKETLQQKAKKMGINCTFHGFLSNNDLEKVYTKCTIQIVPSIFEGFGITVLEAMAKKIPVIATEVDGLKSIITNNYNGLLVQYGNKEMLASTILKLLHDTKLQQKISSNAYKELEKYDWKKIYQSTHKLYEEIAN